MDVKNGKIEGDKKEGRKDREVMEVKDGNAEKRKQDRTHWLLVMLDSTTSKV